MTEKLLAGRVKDACPMAHWDRIENTAGNGMGDMNGCWMGTEVWIELKEIHNLRISNLRPSQVAWHTKRWLKGGRCYVLMWDAVLKTWFYIKGCDVGELMEIQLKKHSIPMRLQHPISDLKTWLEDRFIGSRE